MKPRVPHHHSASMRIAALITGRQLVPLDSLSRDAGVPIGTLIALRPEVEELLRGLEDEPDLSITSRVDMDPLCWLLEA